MKSYFLPSFFKIYPAKVTLWIGGACLLEGSFRQQFSLHHKGKVIELYTRTNVVRQTLSLQSILKSNW
ncbi:MAG: hypothetical protein C4323_11710 [Mastigocladus sp. ERB_26_2]